jgi:hypothetical protein
MPGGQKYFLGAGIIVCILLLVTSAIFLLEAIKRSSSPTASTISPVVVQESSNKSGEVVAQELPVEKTIGNVGEVKIKDENSGEEKSIVTPSLPAVITSTVGLITARQGNAIIIDGLGSNFADGINRELRAMVTENTLVLADGGAKQYKGRDSLEILIEGRKVLIEGEGNIRGKTEFDIKTINILD